MADPNGEEGLKVNVCTYLHPTAKVNLHDNHPSSVALGAQITYILRRICFITLYHDSEMPGGAWVRDTPSPITCSACNYMSTDIDGANPGTTTVSPPMQQWFNYPMQGLNANSKARLSGECSHNDFETYETCMGPHSLRKETPSSTTNSTEPTQMPDTDMTPGSAKALPLTPGSAQDLILPPDSDRESRVLSMTLNQTQTRSHP
ncbi:hypothetical protein Baya_15514 [Bagarius yarrelli]|uniref:Uncharacterized protein n=1 Tax=Bagarius yarrelli TaxID=175774 RepID=A0A556VBZ0_BAGYA|nr:hypothetical protein Baya_15514 [Bagarius yarrelli]